MREKKKGTRTWGYARVSTDDQELRMQIDALEAYGVDGIFKEKASGGTMEREALNWMMDDISLRRGDTIVVYKLDRLGRSVKGLIEAIEHIQDRGARLVSLNDHIDTGTANGRLLFNVIAAVAQWEREMISERTKAGMAAAKRAGQTFGRKHMIKGNKKRLKKARELDKADKLRTMLDRDLMNVLNEADKSEEIKSLETVRRWRRDDYPGLYERDASDAQ